MRAGLLRGLRSLAAGLPARGAGGGGAPLGTVAVRRGAEWAGARGGAEAASLQWRAVGRSPPPAVLAWRVRGPLPGVLRGFVTTPRLLAEPAPAAAAATDAVSPAEGGVRAGGRPAKEADSAEVRHAAQHHVFPRAHSKAFRLRTSVKKLKLVCQLVRRANVDAALLQLSLSPQKAAKFVRKLIHECKFNAAAMGLNPEKLVVDELLIGRGPYMKRMEFKGRGKTGVRKKPTCNLYVYVREQQESDTMMFHHVKRKRPRWKCGRLRGNT